MNSPFNKLAVFYRQFMIVVYIGMGLFILFSGFLNINVILKTSLGIILIAYGIIRYYRYKKIKDETSFDKTE